MMKNLKFRRQYILINKSVKIQEGWNNLNFRQNKKNWNLYSHVDLDVLSKKNKKYELILIGYILDPFNPDYDNDQILSNLCLLNSFEEILHKTENYNGRFILIFVNESTIRLFNDATGFREIYHYNKGEIIACGSTPNILSEYIDIDKDSDKEINEFFNSPEFNSPERQWIGTRTIYEGIGHLLPNHYLNLTTNRVVRFWPDKVFQKQKLKNVTEFMADILTGTYKAATRRFKLYQGLTSGWDTRLLLAASKQFKNQITFYFNRGFKKDTNAKTSKDFIIAKEIADKYNIPLNVIETSDIVVDNEFSEIYYYNNILSRSKLLNIYYDTYINKLDSTVTVSGTMGNEILRIMFPISRNVKTGKDIAKLLDYVKYKFVVDEIDEWIEEMKETVKNYKYRIIDLFNWEQFFGNWGALSGSEQDIVREELRPFNCRALLSAYISLSDKYRYRDYPLGYVKIIEYLWKDLLKFSMNLQKYRLKKLLRFFDLERTGDKFYQYFK